MKIIKEIKLLILIYLLFCSFSNVKAQIYSNNNDTIIKSHVKYDSLKIKILLEQKQQTPIENLYNISENKIQYDQSEIIYSDDIQEENQLKLGEKNLYLHPTTGLQNTYNGECMEAIQCGTTHSYYDNGGSSGNYSNNINQIYRTFCPSEAGKCVRATINNFNIEEKSWLLGGGCYDYLSIGSGPTQNVSILWKGCGTNSSPETMQGTYSNQFISTDPSGCLVFRFYSDGSTTESGWNITLDCVPCSYGPSSNESNDCINAIPICSDEDFIGSSDGPGISSDGCSGCQISENYSTWYHFIVKTGGTIALTIIPDVSSDDYDFALYQASNCGSLGTPIRCSYAANVGNGGMVDGAGDNSEDVYGDGWVEDISVSAGQSYYLLINNWTAGGAGFTLDWTFSGGASMMPPVTASASQISICAGQTSTLTASGADTYTWSNSLGSGSSKTVTPTSTTTYTVTGSLSSGCSNTATVTVTVNSTPTISVTASPTSICVGGTSVLTASGASTYSWSTGGSTASITVTPSVTTIYTVTGTTNDGCTGTASVTINVSQPPIIDYTTAQSHCGQSDGNIMTNVTGGIPPYIYQWSNGAISPNLSNISSGSYILTVSDNNGCSSSISITVTEAPKPQANFAPKPQITTIDDPIIYFENYSIGASSYEWDFGDGYNSSEFSPIHTYQNAGEYHILLSAIDQYGCIDTAGANVIIQEFNTYYVPNAFTPNRNELNESFNIFGSGINPNTFEMRIFDRWGKEIFFTKDINQGWDGTFKGEIVPAGIYTYIIKFEDSQGYRKNVITGKVILAK